MEGDSQKINACKGKDGNVLHMQGLFLGVAHSSLLLLFFGRVCLKKTFVMMLGGFKD